MMLLRSFAFVARVLTVCVILSCSSARAANCPGRTSMPVHCSAGAMVSVYTAMLFTVQFAIDYWRFSTVSSEITREEIQLKKMSDVMNQMMMLDEVRSVKANSTSFMTMLEKLKKKYEQDKQANKAKIVKNVLRSYRMTPSYYVFIYSLSPFNYEHCLRSSAKKVSCRMIPVGKEPLKLINLNGLSNFFDQLLVYFEQQRDILNSMQLTFSQLFQIGVSYCGSYLNTDIVTMFHPCMKMMSIHVQNYPVINNDWSSLIKTAETDTDAPGSEAIEFKLVSLNDESEPSIGQYRLNGFSIEPVENKD